MISANFSALQQQKPQCQLSTRINPETWRAHPPPSPSSALVPPSSSRVIALFPLLSSLSLSFSLFANFPFSSIRFRIARKILPALSDFPQRRTLRSDSNCSSRLFRFPVACACAYKEREQSATIQSRRDHRGTGRQGLNQETRGCVEDQRSPG